SGLDGKVVVSPSAERIETVELDSSERVGPGSVVRRNVIVANRTERPIDFELAVAEVVGSRSELAVEVRHGSRGGAAAWATLQDSSFTLEPGQQGTVPLTIRVPEEVTPG